MCGAGTHPGGGVTGGMKPAEVSSKIKTEAANAKKVVVTANVKAD